MTQPTPPPDRWPTLLAGVADCVEALGGADFEARLLALLRAGARIEQCMIFAYDAAEGVDCLLADNARQPRLAGRLARLYTEGLFRHDPNYRRLADVASPTLELAPMRAEAMPETYRGPLFAFPDLVDKVTLTLREAEGAYTLNLYRGREAGPFDADDLATLDALAPLLASLIRRHYGTPRPPEARLTPEEEAVLAPLSERERQLCLRLLRGHTLKSAAVELEVALSTAETYRKRAYAKLGIPSKARLVALCRRQ